MSDLDLTKPVQRADGGAAGIYEIDGIIYGWMMRGGRKCLTEWTLEGRLHPDDPGSAGDLVNVPEPTPVVLAENRPYPVLWRGRQADAVKALAAMDRWLDGFTCLSTLELSMNVKELGEALGRVGPDGRITKAEG